MSDPCLSCHLPIEQGPYHEKCLKNLFGTSRAPRISFSTSDIPVQLRQSEQKLFSISGVQIKTLVRLNAEKMELLIAPSEGTHILKPEPTEYPELPMTENLCMGMAAAADLEVPPHGLFPMKDGKYGYVILRFDRTPQGEKIHKEDMAQIMDLPSDSKYSGSLESIGKALWKHASFPGLEALRFFERVLFCFLIGNGDMHLKNWALIRDSQGLLRLSPCYDFVSSRLYIRDEESALTLNGRKNRLRRSDFDVLANSLKIDPKAKDNVYTFFTEKASLWRQMVTQSPLSANRKESLEMLIASRLKHLGLAGA
jgi:serine/threonine-protein kinase HipA